MAIGLHCVDSYFQLWNLFFSSSSLYIFFSFLYFLLLGIYYIYIPNAIPKVPHTLPFFYIVPAPFVENAVFFPLDGFSSLVKDQVTRGAWVHLCLFNSVPLVYLSVTIPVPCSFFFLITIAL